jgi:peptide/nickel transport system substrate-binding protein
MNGEPRDWEAVNLTRRRLLQLGALGAVASPALLAACGGDNSGGGETGGVTTAGTTATTAGGTTSAATAAPSAASQADRTAILRYGQMRGESYDPIRQVAVEEVQLNCIFDTLLTSDPVTGELKPRLASSWEVQPDRVRLKPRQGVTFQDGTPFNADAVKFSLDRVKSDPDSNIKSQVWQLAGTAVVDPTTIDLMMSPAAAIPLLYRLTGRPGMIVSPTAVQAAGSNAAFSNAPVGAGMYKVEGAWQPREKMSVRAWPGYWDKDAALLGGIDFGEIALTAKANAILSGSIDVGSISANDLPAIQGNSATKIIVDPAATGRGLVLNPNIAPMDNLKLRQAIAYAVDRRAMVQALSNGIGKPAYQPFAENSPAFDPKLEGLYDYDPDKAKALMAEAGVPDGFTFQSVIGANTGVYVTISEFLQSQLDKVGIKMDLQLVDQSRTVPMVWRERTAATSALAQVATAVLTDSSIRDQFMEGGVRSTTGQDYPGIRPLMEQAAAATTLDAAKPAYQAVNKILTEQQYIMIFCLDPSIITFQKYVGGISRGFADTDVSPELLRGVFITQGKKALE